jgi:DNA-binding transcriptional regulator YiaG
MVQVSGIKSLTHALSSKGKQADSKELKELRERLGWTRVQFASIIGVTVPTLESWESGRGSIRADLTRLSSRNALECLIDNDKPVLDRFSLQNARKFLGLKSEELASILGVKLNTWRAYEKGSRKASLKLVRDIEVLVEKHTDLLDDLRSI